MPTKGSPTRTIVFTTYLYIFIGIGLLLMSIGSYQLAQNLFKSYALPKYHLGFEESRCDYIRFTPAAIEDPSGKLATDSAQDQEKAYNECKSKLEEDRTIKQITDFYTSIITLTIGVVLFVGHVGVAWKTNRT